MERVYRRNIVSQQLSFKLRSFARLRALPRKLAPTRKSGSRAVLWTAVACIYLLDTVIGVVAVRALRWVCPEVWLEEAVTRYILTSLHWLGELLQWTTGAPAGLKLNVPLATFIALKLIAILHLWEFFYRTFIQLYLTHIISLIFTLRWLGLSVLLAALYDFLKFLNLCLICFYIFSSRLLWLQLSALRSLARLFMGQKWNPLRCRVDSCDFDTSQLLLGTLLFTILLFLLPTTSLFFVLFLVLRVAQFSLQSSIRLLIVLVNKLVVSMATLLESAYTTPNINTLQFEITEVKCPDNRRRVVGIWNGRRLGLAEVQELIATSPGMVEEEEELRDRISRDHSMLHWVDVAPF